MTCIGEYSLLAAVEANKLVVSHGSGAVDEALARARLSESANDTYRQLLWEQAALEVQLALVQANAALSRAEIPLARIATPTACPWQPQSRSASPCSRVSRQSPRQARVG